MQTEDTFAADCWVYSNETTNWFVQDETIQWRRDGLDCRVNVKTASKDPNNTAKTKIHHKHYSYYNGECIIVCVKAKFVDTVRARSGHPIGGFIPTWQNAK